MNALCHTEWSYVCVGHWAWIACVILSVSLHKYIAPCLRAFLLVWTPIAACIEALFSHTNNVYFVVCEFADSSFKTDDWGFPEF